MIQEPDFQITIKGRYVQCWICEASKDDGVYGSYTTNKWPDGRLFITPHRVGCVWSDEAGDGEVNEGLARSLYGAENVDRN